MEKKYRRYHIEAQKCANLIPHPHRFLVKVKKLGLAGHILKEIFQYKTKWKVIASRPCKYGVFSGPIGGFAPRPHLCVGCLRCTTEHPEMVSVLHNPERKLQGDSYFTSDYVDTIAYEAENGRVPIKGAGYRGKFGGQGWDGMWTDMSEIVRPTRDGIHGREFISTEVDVGEKPSFLKFEGLNFTGKSPQTLSIPIPLFLDALPPKIWNETLGRILIESAQDLETFTILPLDIINQYSLEHSCIIPLIKPEQCSKAKELGFSPLMIEMEEWSENAYRTLQSYFPEAIFILRTDFESSSIMESYHAGVRVFHLTADYHGRGKSGKFILDLIQDVQNRFVQERCRDQVTLIGSGGIIAAEHIPKAIICGLDAIALDTPVIMALQGKFLGPCLNWKQCDVQFPAKLAAKWGRQRLKNVACAWRDQLLEILGAMGIREVRRLRGEMGRAMFQKDLEQEAFSGIAGYGE
jgi:hypothetical protein